MIECPKCGFAEDTYTASYGRVYTQAELLGLDKSMTMSCHKCHYYDRCWKFVREDPVKIKKPRIEKGSLLAKLRSKEGTLECTEPVLQSSERQIGNRSRATSWENPVAFCDHCKDLFIVKNNRGRCNACQDL